MIGSAPRPASITLIVRPGATRLKFIVRDVQTGKIGFFIEGIVARISRRTFRRQNLSNDNRLLDEGEVDFDAPLGVNIPAANHIVPNLAAAVTDEITLSLEQDFEIRFAVAAY